MILVLDALQPLERQDLTIARLVADEGRAMVLAASKWDAVAERCSGAATIARAGCRYRFPSFRALLSSRYRG